MSDIADVMGNQGFDTNSVEPQGTYDPLPAGWYEMMIDEADVIPTKKGDGAVLKLKLIVVQDEYKGRGVFHRINLQNPNPKCVEIGMRELAGLGQACGLATITDSSELKDKVVLAKLAVKADEGFDPSNEVKGYKSMNAEAAPASAAKAAPRTTTKAAPKAASAAPASAPKSATAGKRPWER